MCLVFACYVGQWSSLMIWLPTYLVDERGISQSGASLVTALFVAVNIPGNLAGGWILKRGVARWRVIAFASFAMALTASGALSATLPDALRLASLLAFSMLGGLIPAAVLAGVPVHAPTPQHIGTTQGMIMQASQSGQFFGPLLLALGAQQAGGWSASLGIMLILAAIALGASFLLGRFEQRLGSATSATAR